MNIQIPAEYQDKLSPIKYDHDNEKTDDEILSSLLDYQPVTSEKNIWTFWDSGIRNMPAWCRRNVIGWIRICGPDWTVRVLDSDPTSPNYAAKYIPSGLPDAFYQHTLDGIHVGPHSADFLRGACLYDYGGIWMDSSIFLMRHVDDICWNVLEDASSPYRVVVPVALGNLLNCFMAARKHDPFIKRWHDLFMHVWQGRNNSKGIAQHPLLSPILPHFARCFTDYNHPLKGLDVLPFDAVADYGAQMICWMRVCMLEDAGDGFSGADYWVENIKWINCGQELMRILGADESSLDYTMGPKIFDLLALRRDGPTNSELYKEAEKLVWTLLTEASMIKIGTVKGLVDWVSLGTLWNMPENHGKDNGPGTFAELLRCVPLHYKQTRNDVLTYKPKKASVTFKKGVLEP